MSLARDESLRAAYGLTGRTALVTGARSGIGAASAVALAAAGADLVLWGTTVERLADTAAACEAHGARVTCDAVDLRDLAATEARAAALAASAEISILVNNAGVIGRGPAGGVTTESWREVVTVDLDAVFVLSRILGTEMVQRGTGSIVNIASLLSFQGGLNVAAYAASKHAVAGLTKALANEWAGHGVNVNAVAPGYVVTDNTAALRADEARYEAISERIPAGRWAEPGDIAGAVAFLASPAARYIHGHVLVVDGGWLGR